MSLHLGLIGYPIQHSLSPWIHQTFLEKSNLRGSYNIMEIPPAESFADKMEALKKSKIDGFNVTVPFKKQIIPYLDVLDDQAKAIGAVNTVVCNEGKWTGYNTDGVGYVTALQQAHPGFFENKTNRILIVGAGGAARGIYYGLLSAGFVSIDIANRTKPNAVSIASLKPEDCQTSILTLAEAEEAIHTYDLVIQTTSVGMKPNVNEQIIDVKGMKENSIASDIVYQPIKTAFLASAKQAGAFIHYGHTMLLYQAQHAFKHWTNREVPINNMENELRTILEGR